MSPTSSATVCRRDGVSTRLTCAACGAPICPRCLARTAVGFKCPDCITTTTGERRSRRRLPRWTFAVASTVVLAAAAVVLLRPDGGDTGDPVGAAARTEPPPAGQVMLGEEADDGQIAFTVTDFGCGEKQLGARTAEGKFCRLHLDVRNRSGGPASVLGRFQYLLDGKGKTFGADLALSEDQSANGGRTLSEVSVNPDITVAMVLVFDVPESLDPLEAQLRGTGSSRFGVRVRLERRTA